MPSDGNRDSRVQAVSHPWATGVPANLKERRALETTIHRPAGSTLLEECHQFRGHLRRLLFG